MSCFGISWPSTTSLKQKHEIHWRITVKQLKGLTLAKVAEVNISSTHLKPAACRSKTLLCPFVMMPR